MDGTDTHGATAAWYACSEDSPAVLSQLLDRDCDLNVSTLLILLCIWSPVSCFAVTIVPTAALLTLTL